MRCIRGLVILAGAVTVLAPATLRLPAGQAAGQTQVAVSGYITDTLCGRKGATPNHVECAKRSVASGKAQYALYDERTRKLYILEPADAVVPYLGQRVRISGSVTATPIRTAGESYAPDAVATATTRGAVSATSGAPLPSATPRVQQHPKALDTTTPVAGILSISSVAPVAK